MKLTLVLFSVVVASVLAQDLAQPCDASACQLPDCRCSGTDIPGGLAPRDTPQFVLLTFDDGVNVLNIETYRRIIYNRINRNGCPSGSTFFVNHEYTNYQLINELYNNGYEIALHSMSHQTPQTYWQQATYENMMNEFGDQRVQMSHFANIPLDEVKGVRIPFLQMTGNATFEVMRDVGLQYDSTWGAINSINPGLWPYTLDYASTQECMIPPCPTASIPGVWVKPLISWLDLNGTPCAMVDSCFAVPALDDEDGWFDFIVSNFERHYLGNRSPFGFYVHEWYVSSYSGVERALVRFMDMINNMNDVFMVNGADVVEWTRNPVPLNEYVERPCRTFTPTTCPASNCGPLTSTHNTLSYYVAVCNVCPRVYPWLGNPLGQ